ncbi:MAG: VWA domain-containing protein, partial [Bacteroidales bacterium]|nr:VWA domain-containing protein [Bacteroidales bacterium]
MIVILLMVQWVQPLEVYAKSRIEIVFIIDRSGSMGDDISNVRKNINDFTALLEGQGIDYRLGLVTYETYPIKYDLTDNVEKFRGYLNGVNVNGGTENGLDAIMEAIDTYTYYENAAKYFILIGDEPIYSDRHHSLGSVKQSLVHEDIILTNIGVTNASDLVQATGGLSLNLSGDFSTQLTKIFEQIQTIPILEIIAPTPQQWLSGRDHAFIPTVKVTDPDSDQLTLEYYIDNETTPKDSKTVTNTKTEQIIRFNALNIGELTEGQHSFKFTVNDGSETVQDTVSINVDKTAPNLGTVNFASTDRSITVSGSATDTLS